MQSVSSEAIEKSCIRLATSGSRVFKVGRQHSEQHCDCKFDSALPPSPCCWQQNSLHRPQLRVILCCLHIAPCCTKPVRSQKRCEEFCRIFADAFDQRDDPWVNPFYQLNWKSVQSACCSQCAASWEQIQKMECDQAWQAMPSYFDLPPWNELEKLTYGSDS